MKRFQRLIYGLGLALIYLTCKVDALELRDGDRLILLGGTFIEREQQYGYLETALQLSFPKIAFSIRNLGWSGDTVEGHARSYFGPPAEGLERLQSHVKMIQPSLAVLGYGAHLAFEDTSKIPAFIANYEKLIHLLKQNADGLRLVLVSPPPCEPLAAPLPNLDHANAQLKLVRDAVRDLAKRLDLEFIDVFEVVLQKQKAGAPKLTDNGVHYDQQGYRQFVDFMLESQQAPAVAWEHKTVEEIRQSVVRKDFLFFNRWRPANETYLHGFRKHEQGQNAREMAQFDPLVLEMDAKILKLKQQYHQTLIP